MERVFVIPLGEVKKAPRSKRVQKAVKHIRSYASKHTKSSDVKISDALNKKLWKQGMRNIPSKIEVKASTSEDGGVLLTPVE
jgi:large subunit ribosomal protein L31e